MNLLSTNFYNHTLLEHTETTLAASIVFNSSHPIFEGHFPGRPVVPGVCLMQMVREHAEATLGKKLRIVAAPQIKFLQLITPETAPTLQLTCIKEEDNHYQVDAVFQGDKPLAKISLRLQELSTRE